MASVAICPHCYLQLAIPEHASRDAEVECPSCHTEFGLEKATVRDIPAGVVKGSTKATPSVEEAGEELPETVAAEHADTDIAAWFRSNKTVSDVAPLVGEMAAAAELTDSTDDTHDADAENDEDDAVTNAQDPTTLDEQSRAAEPPPHKAVPARASTATLADWESMQSSKLVPGDELKQADEIELDLDDADAALPGPSFDLPHVPLTPATNATVEFGSDEFNEVAAGTDFELEGVELHSRDNSWMKDEFNPADETREPGHDPNARTMEDVGLLDQRLRESSYEESLRNSAEEPASDRYEHSTTAAETDHGDSMQGFPTSLPQRGGRRKRSALRTMVSALAAAPVGLAIGYYLFLWYFGPRGDFLQMSKYIPPKFLPASFAAAAPREESAIATQTEPVAETAAEPVTKESAKESANDSANVPASYETPVKPAAKQSAVGKDDRYAMQSSVAAAPPEEIKPAAEPGRDEPQHFAVPNASSLSGDEARVVAAPLFTVAEYATTLSKAEAAETGLVTGDLSDPAVRREKGMSYAKLCDLAQVVTFCDDPSSADRLSELNRNAEELFQRTLSNAHTRNEVAQIAKIWIDSPHRQHGGVFLAGAIHGGDAAGDTYEYQLSTEAGGELQMLLPHSLDAKLAGGHPVGIVGSIVDDPASKISGYTGKSPRVIWVRDVISLE